MTREKLADIRLLERSDHIIVVLAASPVVSTTISAEEARYLARRLTKMASRIEIGMIT